MPVNSARRSLLIVIVAAIALTACASPQPTASISPSLVPTRAAPTSASVAATDVPPLIPPRVVTRSADARSAAPSLVGAHPLSGSDLVINLNAGGTVSLDAPAIDQGAPARSWRGQWAPDSDRGAVITLDATDHGTDLLLEIGFKVAVLSDTLQLN